MVAEKLDPTVDQLCFCRIFQTVRNLQKGTKGMSSEGPKMVGERYGSAWSGRKMQKNGDPRWRRGLRNGVLVNLKLFILEKVNFGPHTKCWSNLVKSGQT